MAARWAVLALVVVNCVLGVHSWRSDEVSAANFAVEFHNSRSNSLYAYKVVSIVSASIQMLPPARVKYTMTVKVGRTVCKNEPHLNLQSCALQTSQPKTTICDVIVLADPHSKVPSHLLEDHCY